jgi:hypothetical protein
MDGYEVGQPAHTTQPTTHGMDARVLPSLNFTLTSVLLF